MPRSSLGLLQWEIFSKKLRLLQFGNPLICESCTVGAFEQGMTLIYCSSLKLHSGRSAHHQISKIDYTITINRAINSAVVFASPSLRMPVSIAHFFHQLVHFLAMCLCILRGRGLKKFWQIYFIASLLENRLKCTQDA